QRASARRGLRSFAFSPLGCYFISLMICDLLQGAAFALNFRWAALGLMSEGPICTIQGAVSEVGDLGAAIWSTAISIHTFWLLFLVRQPNRRFGWLAMTSGWVLIICLPILGPTAIQSPHKGRFYGLSGAWCWIGNGYGWCRVLFLYGWVFGALLTSFIIYSLIYLRFTNVVTIGRDGCENVEHDYMNSTLQVNSPLKVVAQKIMWYPIVYSAVVLPVAICRMGVLAGWNPPFGLFIFAGICFTSSGTSITNTILFVTTRQSFITQNNQAQITRVHVTTQHVILRD
ncbi:hypothetical protein BU17DRAFT_15252, partial [Hysterangium stoloniferum]